MRPTIPFAEWRLAIDLAATRAIDALTTPPARGCNCVDCQRWANSHENLLPVALREELTRIGVDPARPLDVYVTSTSDTAATMRVSYGAVGRILSGPAELAGSSTSGTGRNYVILREAPALVAVAIAYQESIGGMPDWAPKASHTLLAIDLWVNVPATDAGAPHRHRKRQAAV